MSEWRFIATRLNGDGTETIIHPELPLTGASVTREVSGPGALDGTIDPSVQSLRDSSGAPILIPHSTAIYAEENDVIRHGAILQSRSITGSQLTLSCAGFTTKIKSEPYIGSIFFVKTDPLDIARHMWAHHQGLQGANVGMVVDTKSKVGRLIGTELRQVEFDTQNGPVSFEAGPYKLNQWETDDLGGKFDGLAKDYGFDYMETHRWNAANTGFTHSLDFGVPRIGTRKSNLRFVVGDNVLVQPSLEMGDDDYYSAVLVRGAGEGATMKKSLVLRPGETRLRRTYVHEDKQLKSDTACGAKAREILGYLNGFVGVTSLTVRPSDWAPIGSWVEGDEVELFTDTDWNDESIFVRILSTTFNPDGDGSVGVSVIRSDKMPL